MKTPSFTVALLLVGCASTGPDPTGNAALQHAADAVEAPSGATGSDVEVVKELEISAFAEDGVVCRREAPLGSRITVERCYSTVTGESAQSSSLDQIARDEFETMRRRQMFLDQQRAARETAIRQRPTPSQ